MPKKKINEEELKLFEEAMKDIKPLKHNKITLGISSIRSPGVKPTLNEPRKARFFFEENFALDPITQEAYLSFKRPEIADKLLRKLKKGQYNIQLVLDLHGLTVREAEIELSHFFTECQLHAIRIVLLIHGKGKEASQPILKNKLNQWLRHYPPVLAFCTATPRHGGTGAVYVLLKDGSNPFSNHLKEEFDF